MNLSAVSLPMGILTSRFSRCRQILLFAHIAALFFNVSAASPAAPEALDIRQVAPGVYLHQGHHVGFDHPHQDDIANIGFIAGDKCIAVIDSGGSVSTGRRLLATIRQTSQLPLCYVINTHVHFDHTLGNLAFVGESPEFVGHMRLHEAIEQSRDFFLRRFKQNLGEDPDKESIVGVDLSVDKLMELDLGNRIIRLQIYQTAHSSSDLTVLDLKTSTLWAGDLLFAGRIPVLDGNLKGWLAVLQDLRQQEFSLVIPGHGDISRQWPSAYHKQQRYLEMLLSDVRQAIAEQRFLEEVLDDIGSRNQQQWLLYNQHHKANITKAYIELEWE